MLERWFAWGVTVFAVCGCAAPAPEEEDVGASSDRMESGQDDDRSSAMESLEGERVDVLRTTEVPRRRDTPLLLGMYSGNQCFLYAGSDAEPREPEAFLGRGLALRVGRVAAAYTVVGGLGRTRVRIPLRGANDPGLEIRCTVTELHAREKLTPDRVLTYVGPRFRFGDRPVARDSAAEK